LRITNQRLCVKRKSLTRRARRFTKDTEEEEEGKRRRIGRRFTTELKRS